MSASSSQPEAVLVRYPLADKSEEARYARAIAYFQKPELKLALDEINSLIKDEPKNPYFYEVLGQIYVSMAQPEKGVLAYQKAVNAMPDAPLLRTLLATAQLATERQALAKPALDNLKVSLQQDPDDSFGWYETAAAYSALNNQPMADLSTAEMYYYAGAMPKAAHVRQARRARICPKAPPIGSAPTTSCRSPARRPGAEIRGSYEFAMETRRLERPLRRGRCSCRRLCGGVVRRFAGQRSGHSRLSHGASRDRRRHDERSCSSSRTTPKISPVRRRSTNSA